MNVQKIFEALAEDSQNSALGIICGELEDQGYAVKIDGVPVSSAGFYNGKHSEIEKKLGDLEFFLTCRTNAFLDLPLHLELCHQDETHPRPILYPPRQAGHLLIQICHHLHYSVE